MLPEPRNTYENDFLNNMGATSWFFLGLTDKAAEDQWQWNSDRSTVGWSLWKSGEPDGGRNQNCAAQLVNGGIRKKWTSTYCRHDGSFEIPVVCERRGGKYTINL